jgi:hypothetical protein
MNSVCGMDRTWKNSSSCYILFLQSKQAYLRSRYLVTAVIYLYSPWWLPINVSICNNIIILHPRTSFRQYPRFERRDARVTCQLAQMFSSEGRETLVQRWIKSDKRQGQRDWIWWQLCNANLFILINTYPRVSGITSVTRNGKQTKLLKLHQVTSQLSGSAVGKNWKGKKPLKCTTARKPEHTDHSTWWEDD